MEVPDGKVEGGEGGGAERESILKDGRSAWEVSKVPRQKRVKLITPADKQTAL